MDKTYIVYLISKKEEGSTKQNWIIGDVVFSLESAFESVDKYLRIGQRQNKPCLIKIALEDDVDWKENFNYELTKLKKAVKWNGL